MNSTGDTPPKTERDTPGPRAGGIRGVQKPVRVTILALAALAVLAVLWFVISYFWTDYLWYQEMGHTEVFWTPFIGRLCVGLIFAVLFFALFYGSLRVARRLSPKFHAVEGDPSGRVLEVIMRRRWSGRLILIVSIAISLLIGIAFGGRWREVLLFMNKEGFGYADPLFGNDASFYVYTLPFLRLFVSFFTTAAVLALICTLLLYASDRAFTMSAKNRVRPTPAVYGHASVLLALITVAQAADFFLGRWGLVYSRTGGFVSGANYTDVNFTLPILAALAVVSLVAAVLFLVNLFFRGWKIPVMAIGLILVVWLVGGKIVPYAVQSLQVKPNEYAKDGGFIANNIESTRWAFGIDDTSTLPLQASSDLTGAEVAANSGTIENIRVWGPRTAMDAFRQQQSIAPYYTFNDVDIDRYILDGKLRQVLISARELDRAKLEPNKRTWVNEHLTYTHGYGLVFARVNEAGSSGSPVYLVKDMPPVESAGLNVTQPRIYYGEMGDTFVIVNTNTQEFDYPEKDSEEYSSYEGTGGIPVGGFWRQAAFTFRLGSLSILTSGSVSSDSRIMFRRTLQDRVRALAPFLNYDYDPYLVLREDGSLVWMWDAYTTTDLFPYSEPWSGPSGSVPNHLLAGTNYVRNSVKVVIDAYDGDITFYLMDNDDSIAMTWAKIYEDLFTPADQMPADLRAHMRYPENMYSVQADVMTRYHMTDPLIFYGQQDAWQIPTEVSAQDESQTDPYYQVLALPGETEPESALLLPFAPKNKANMLALLMARQDGDRYGELLLIDFPKGRLTDGPAQVEAMISNDPVISQQLTLWDQAGSNVIRGNLLVVPIGQSVVYFKPIYLQASIENTIPQLRRVIVAYGTRVVMEPTVSAALARVFGEEAGGDGTSEPGSTTTTTVGGTTVPPDAAALIEQANQLYLEALEAQRAGDWAGYGRLIQQLGDVLSQLAGVQ